MDGLSAGVSQYTTTRDGKTGDFSLPLIGVTVWEFIRELAKDLRVRPKRSKSRINYVAGEHT